MKQEFSDEEISAFIDSQRKVKEIRILAGNIQKHFGERALDERGRVSEAFWGRLYQVSASYIQLQKARYLRLLLSVISAVILLGVVIFLAIYFRTH